MTGFGSILAMAAGASPSPSPRTLKARSVHLRSPQADVKRPGMLPLKFWHAKSQREIKRNTKRTKINIEHKTRRALRQLVLRDSALLLFVFSVFPFVFFVLRPSLCNGSPARCRARNDEQ